MAVNNSLAQKKKQSPMAVYLQNDAVKNQINKIVGGKNSARFISSIVSAVQTTPALQECTNSSIVSAALLGEALNLSPSPQLGQFYMVPFNNKKKGVVEASFIIGYKGLIQLAIRSGYYKKLNVLPLKEGELIRYDPLEEEIEVRLIEDEEEREKAPTSGYYAMFEYSNGFRKTLYWSKAKMISHADRYSQAFSANATGGRYPKVSFADYEAGKVPKGDEWLYSSFWYKDFDAMALKTMIRQLISKWGVMSIDLQTAIEKDDSIINEDGTSEYVENVENVEGPAEPAEIVNAVEPAADMQIEEHSNAPVQSPEPAEAPVKEPEQKPEPAINQDEAKQKAKAVVGDDFLDEFFT